jgi:hypothetical protein
MSEVRGAFGGRPSKIGGYIIAYGGVALLILSGGRLLEYLETGVLVLFIRELHTTGWVAVLLFAAHVLAILGLVVVGLREIHLAGRYSKSNRTVEPDARNDSARGSP